MVITCYACHRQIAFKGNHTRRRKWADLFGWIVRAGRYFCASCAEITQ